jgi:hypothetical protein
MSDIRHHTPRLTLCFSNNAATCKVLGRSFQLTMAEQPAVSQHLRLFGGGGSSDMASVDFRVQNVVHTLRKIPINGMDSWWPCS